MKRPRLKALLLVPIALFLGVYSVALIVTQLDDTRAPTATGNRAPPARIAILGASGTAGDGILKAAMADPDVQQIQVITRRITDRMAAGEAIGKVAITTHLDYLDYAAVHEQIRNVDAVYWAIGISALKVDEETYGRIHVDFPVRFVTEWLDVSSQPAVSFHYISSSDISADSSANWAREKVRAENALIALAEGTKLKVIAYRPDYIAPTYEEEHLGQWLAYSIFAPVGVAVRASKIGQAMLEVTARGAAFSNGDKLSTAAIIRYANAATERTGWAEQR
ncbi:MAG: hypothetical protein AAGA61_04285 [Pseudomonadota bacterium]